MTTAKGVYNLTYFPVWGLAAGGSTSKDTLGTQKKTPHNICVCVCVCDGVCVCVCDSV